MKKAVVALAVVCAAMLSYGSGVLDALMGSLNFATTYYWCGSAESNVLDKANWFLDQNRNQPANAIPGEGDTISACWNGNEVLSFDDDSIAMLTKVSLVSPRDGYTIIDISTNASVTAAIRNWGYSTVIKRGAGTLTLLATGSGSNNSSYLESWRVERGEVVFGPQITDDSTYWLGQLDVWEGARAWLYPGKATTRCSKGICGAGTIAKETTTGKTGKFYVDGNTTKPFSGYLTGNFNLYPCGKCYLTGVTNDFPCGIFYYGGTLGFVKYSGAAGSSLGAGSGRSQTYHNNFTILCLATEEDGPQTTSECSIWDWQAPTAGSGRIVHDAGAFGGVTYAAGTEWDSVFNGYKEIVLTGSNTAECVFRAQMIEKNDHTGRYYLTKRGTGTWTMGNKSANSTTVENRPILAGIGVENGTLKFESIAEAGANCSLGPGTACLGYAYKGPASGAPAEADYAIRLGSTNLAENGVFQYSGFADVLCMTRPIAVAGNGTLANGTDKVFRWYGAKALGALPEGGEKPAANALTLADNGSEKNTLTGLTEEPGAAPLKVVKTGSGRWTLDGELTFTGGVDVREGTLEIANCNYCNWFRFTFVESYYGMHPEFELAPDNWSRIYILLGELGLFDAEGNRVNLGLGKGANHLPDATRPALAEGMAAFGYAGNDHSTQKLVNSFDGDGSTGTYMNRGVVVTQTNEASWVSVVMHLPRRTPQVTSFDYQYYKSFNKAYAPCSPKRVKIEGSMDGLSWFTIKDATELPDATTTTKWLVSGQAFTGPDDVVTNGLPLNTAHAGPTVLPNGLSSVKVGPGARLDILGSPLKVSKLEIGADGMGTLANAILAEDGVIELADFPRDKRALDLPATFENCEGVERLADWTVRSGGRSGRISVIPTEEGLRFLRHGAVLLVR